LRIYCTLPYGSVRVGYRSIGYSTGQKFGYFFKGLLSSPRLIFLVVIDQTYTDNVKYDYTLK